ncbi:hypothetical protein F5J12DRAFT_799566 [Pisolithus orientalis]|uniref:uncharacterized protein n=1 Tax=Pisolithus orientalis TaxID=936130 RepID=UPI0022254097|nr:uncharacterized protein F5J12DRAFT_799566 [Pisolithus orientalis]KAI6033225.1 hypothetical protein F5J12DRAFT_799566 [Pisolithus orientalis]
MLSNLSFGSSKSSQLRPSGPPVSPNTLHFAIFSSIDDELRDVGRVHSQGQEEDLRHALERVIKRVEELSSLLKVAYKTQSNLETQLNLAKSNLQLVISNNEMLEEALRRETPCSARDVGWRRWSAREVQNLQKTVEDRPKSLDCGALNESGKPSVPSSATTLTANGAQQPDGIPATSGVQPRTPMTSQESRFLRFMLGSGLKSPPVASHLTSPSLPSLVSDTKEREFQDLQYKYECERQAHQTIAAEKAALEAELESLSQALFEEKRNFKKQCREKDALREALRVVEGENGQLPQSLEVPENPVVNQPHALSALEHRPYEPSVVASKNTLGVKPPCEFSDLPDHLKGFTLEPAPKPSEVAFRRTQVLENLKETGISAASEDAPSTPSSNMTFLSVLPDEPSPWADMRTST